MANDKEINMGRANYMTMFFFLILIFTSCENKTKHAESVVFDKQSVVEQSASDTTSSVQEEAPKTAASVSSSSSQSQQSDSYDNMRGFDPASEDDMDDNGMSRYMENDDEEGWD